MAKAKKKENFISSFLWILLLALLFRSFFFTSYNIPTGSMINTLKIGDYIFASKWTYGYSKHFFDQWILSQIKLNQPSPPQWCGLKFFNVYGPNEYHKDRMASVVFHAFEQYQEKKEIRGIADSIALKYKYHNQ